MDMKHSHYGSDCISLMTSDVEYLSICLLTICILSFGVMFTSFALLLTGAIFVFLLMSTNHKTILKDHLYLRVLPNVWKNREHPQISG